MQAFSCCHFKGGSSSCQSLIYFFSMIHEYGSLNNTSLMQLLQNHNSLQVLSLKEFYAQRRQKVQSNTSRILKGHLKNFDF